MKGSSVNSVEELCCYYIAFLRSVALIHQNHHWITRGKEFYGNHLLFERIYNSAQEDVDAMAEKMVGVFNPEVLDLALQSKIIQQTLDKYTSGNPIEGSLKVEQEFLELSQHLYDKLKEEEALTLGLDDAIMSTANSREGAVYLLKGASMEDSTSAVVARTNLLRKLQKASSLK